MANRMTWVMLSWFSRVATWVSQTINLFIFLGHHDQTLSARTHLNQHKPGWKQARVIINGLFFWQEDHCRLSHEVDVAYARDILAATIK